MNRLSKTIYYFEKTILIVELNIAFVYDDLSNLNSESINSENIINLNEESSVKIFKFSSYIFIELSIYGY